MAHLVRARRSWLPMHNTRRAPGLPLLLETRTSSGTGSVPGDRLGRRGKVIEQMLGHGSATMTLDTDGHLFDNRLDEVAEAMARAREAERAAAAHHEIAVAPVLPVRATARGRVAGQRFRWSEPLSLVPPTGFEPALPP